MEFDNIRLYGNNILNTAKCIKIETKFKIDMFTHTVIFIDIRYCTSPEGIHIKNALKHIVKTLFTTHKFVIIFCNKESYQTVCDFREYTLGDIEMIIENLDINGDSDFSCGLDEFDKINKSFTNLTYVTMLYITDHNTGEKELINTKFNKMCRFLRENVKYPVIHTIGMSANQNINMLKKMVFICKIDGYYKSLKHLYDIGQEYKYITTILKKKYCKLEINNTTQNMKTTVQLSSDNDVFSGYMYLDSIEDLTDEFTYNNKMLKVEEDTKLIENINDFVILKIIGFCDLLTTKNPKLIQTIKIDFTNIKTKLTKIKVKQNKFCLDNYKYNILYYSIIKLIDIFMEYLDDMDDNSTMILFSTIYSHRLNIFRNSDVCEECYNNLIRCKVAQGETNESLKKIFNIDISEINKSRKCICIGYAYVGDVIDVLPTIIDPITYKVSIDMIEMNSKTNCFDIEEGKFTHILPLFISKNHWNLSLIWTKILSVDFNHYYLALGKLLEIVEKNKSDKYMYILKLLMDTCIEILKFYENVDKLKDQFNMFQLYRESRFPDNIKSLDLFILKVIVAQKAEIIDYLPNTDINFSQYVFEECMRRAQPQIYIKLGVESYCKLIGEDSENWIEEQVEFYEQDKLKQFKEYSKPFNCKQNIIKKIREKGYFMELNDLNNSSDDEYAFLEQYVEREQYSDPTLWNGIMYNYSSSCIESWVYMKEIYDKKAKNTVKLTKYCYENKNNDFELISSMKLGTHEQKLMFFVQNYISIDYKNIQIKYENPFIPENAPIYLKNLFIKFVETEKNNLIGIIDAKYFTTTIDKQTVFALTDDIYEAAGALYGSFVGKNAHKFMKKLQEPHNTYPLFVEKVNMLLSGMFKGVNMYLDMGQLSNPGFTINKKNGNKLLCANKLCDRNKLKDTIEMSIGRIDQIDRAFDSLL